jgi:DNA-binding HxlR family transcriptional regulator
VARVSNLLVCPYGASGVGGKWMFWSMFHLLDGPKRLSELRRRIPGSGRQMLVAQLRALEEAGVVRRVVFPERRIRVEYSLTPLGREQEPILRRLHDWGEWFGAQCDVDWLVSLGGRWKVWVVHTLTGGPRRFSEIQRLLDPISKQVLARELRELADLGLVERLPAGAYTLTEVGAESRPLFEQLYAWGKRIAPDFPWPLDMAPAPIASDTVISVPGSGGGSGSG